MVKTVEGGGYGDMHRQKVWKETTGGKREERGRAWRERVARTTVRSKVVKVVEQAGRGTPGRRRRLAS